MALPEINIVVPAIELKENDKSDVSQKTEESGIQIQSESPHDIQTNSIQSHRCDECGKEFKSIKNRNKHVQYVHSDEKPYQCERCEKKFKRKSALTHHILHTHSDERPAYTCNVCRKKFKSKSALNRHTENKHGEDVQAKCEPCGKTFRSENQLKSHIRHVHSQPKYTCAKCGRKFKCHGNFNRHKKHTKCGGDGQREFKCDIDGCGKEFFRKDGLTKHIKDNHS